MAMESSQPTGKEIRADLKLIQDSASVKAIAPSQEKNIEAFIFGKDKSPESIKIANSPLNEEVNYIAEGQTFYERFRAEEQSGLVDGGRIHVAASILLGRNDCTGTTSRSTAEEQEATLAEFAKENGIWMENAIEELNSELGPNFANGAESIVWRNRDGSLIKAQDTNHYGDLQQKLDGITLHNSLFPAAKLEVLGFGRINFGDFVVIVKQPFIKAHETKYPKKEVINAYMTVRGFNPYGEHGYMNDLTIVDDLNLTNFIITPGDRVAVFDPQPRLNTPEMGYGGKRRLTKTVEGNGINTI